MRLDKYISDSYICTRKEAAQIIKSGRVLVDGVCPKSIDTQVIPDKNEVMLDKQVLIYHEFIYIMLNKPEGLISATDDKIEKTVLSLLPDKYLTKGLFPAGRLDKDTVGLLILTNDGQTAHKLLSPKKGVEKTYRIIADKDFIEEDIKLCENGIMLDDGLTCPARLVISQTDFKNAEITVTEGKFHEVKRICTALGKKVLFLERRCFGNLSLDESLKRGEWRHLTDEETELLLKLPKTDIIDIDRTEIK